MHTKGIAMTPDELRHALQAWGFATANRFAYSRADRSIHMLDKARDLAPGTTENAMRVLVGRGGRDRRKLMAEAANVGRMTVVPMWACDPVRASNDADPPNDLPEMAVDLGIPENLLWLDRAISMLARQYPMRAHIIRTEYTVSASQPVKRRMVQEEYGGELTLWQYRRELQKGIDWLDVVREAA